MTSPDPHGRSALLALDFRCDSTIRKHGDEGTNQLHKVGEGGSGMTSPDSNGRGGLPALDFPCNSDIVSKHRAKEMHQQHKVGGDGSGDLTDERCGMTSPDPQGRGGLSARDFPCHSNIGKHRMTDETQQQQHHGSGGKGGPEDEKFGMTSPGPHCENALPTLGLPSINNSSGDHRAGERCLIHYGARGDHLDNLGRRMTSPSYSPAPTPGTAFLFPPTPPLTPQHCGSNHRPSCPIRQTQLTAMTKLRLDGQSQHSATAESPSNSQPEQVSKTASPCDSHSQHESAMTSFSPGSMGSSHRNECERSRDDRGDEEDAGVTVEEIRSRLPCRYFRFGAGLCKWGATCR